MEKEHHFTTSWHTTRTSNRAYHRRFATMEEAVAKARKVSRNPYSNTIRVYEMESWDTPDPAPNGTKHIVFLGFVSWD